jgi:hypothetical protein
MGCTVDDSFRGQSKKGRRIDDSDDAIRRINEINNVTVLLPGIRGQPHSATNLRASLENIE